MSDPRYSVSTERHFQSLSVVVSISDHQQGSTDSLSVPVECLPDLVRHFEAHLYGAARPAPDLVERGLGLADSYAACEIECSGRKLTPTFDGDWRYLLTDDDGGFVVRFAQASELLQEAAQWLIDRGHAVKRTAHPLGECVREECVAPGGAEYLELTYDRSL